MTLIAAVVSAIVAPRWITRTRPGNRMPAGERG
jgi:hypothetical protein